MAAPRLRQVCLVAPELAPVEADLAAILDLRPVHRDPNLAVYGLENVILPVGQRFIEIVAPIEANTAAGRFLDSSGGRGGYMAIFDCSDPEARAAHAERLGIPVVNRLAHETYTGRQLHPRHCRAAMIEFNHTEGGADPHGPYWPAGPHWRDAPASTVTRRLAGIDLHTPVPEDLALHWSRILRTDWEALDDGFRLDAVGADLRFRFDENPRECLGALRLTVAEPDAALRRAADRGHPVSADFFHLAGVQWRLNPES